MKTGFKLLFLLTILFCSCYENEVLVSQVEAEIDTEQEALTIEQQAAESSIVVSNLLADMMKAISLSPEVNFDSGERIAEVRNSCPNTYLASDGVYPDTFFVSFNCDPSAVFSQLYRGSLLFILHGEFDDLNVCPLISLQNSPASPSFNVLPDNTNFGEDYGVRILNDVDLCLASEDGGVLKYNYTLDGNIVVDFDNGGTTTYPDGMQGCIRLKSNNKDDLTKPSTLIDNNYCVSAKPTIIECRNRNGDVERLCIATNPEGINYNLRCGCPQSGKLYIDSPANGDCNSIQTTNSFWDYGFIQNPGNSSCENSALDPDNIAQRIPCGQSF